MIYIFDIIHDTNSVKVYLKRLSMEMWMYLVWSSVWMISYTHAQQSACINRYIAKNGSSEDMVEGTPDYIVMRVCVHIHKPKLPTENMTSMNDTWQNESISGNLPLTPLTKSSITDENIAIACTLTTFAVITTFICLIYYFCSKKRNTSTWPGNQRPDVENQISSCKRSTN